MPRIRLGGGKVWTLLFVVVTVVCLASCTATGNKNCTAKTDVFLKADFYSAEYSSSCSLTLGFVKGLGTDSVWMKPTSASTLSLPLQPNDSLTAFAMSFMMIDSTFVTDTVFFLHTNQPYVLSMECGGVVMHDLEAADCTKHCLDSVTIVEAHVDNVLTTNIKIWIP